MQITPQNIDAVLREYEALNFSMCFRKLSEAEAKRHRLLEDALLAIDS